MRVTPRYPIVSVIDGKVYVVEGNGENDSSNLIECFDPKTRKWKDVLRPGAKICGTDVFGSFAMEGNLYLNSGDKTAVYKPKENKWDEARSTKMYLGRYPEFYCVIDNVLYLYGLSEKLKWYDFEGRYWRALKGLENLPKISYGDSFDGLVDYGGKIAVLWKKNEGEEMKIWCAEISLERRNRHEIYGKVECCSVVLTVP